MPCDSATLSPAAGSSSHPSSYDIPEHPPPTTRMRRPHSGLPSSSRRSETFLAAVSVNVIIRAPPRRLVIQRFYVDPITGCHPPAGGGPLPAQDRKSVV